MKISRRQVFWFLAVLIASAAVLRLMVAYTSVHYFDLSFYVDWSAGAARDLFGAYEHVKNLDYPPLFLFPLFLTGKLMALPGVSSFDPYAMLALKGWQMLFDITLIPLLYFVLRRRGELAGLGAAALWAVNPVMIYNSAYWGQTDCIMMFLLAAAFSLLVTRRFVWAGVVMALACLMKFQSLYFAPLFALALVATAPGKRILRTIAAGAATIFAVFLPFCLRSGWALPFEIYFGGFSQYQGASLNAFNFYSAVGMNYWGAGTKLFGALTADGFSSIIIAASLLALLFFYFTASEKSVWLLGAFFMQTIFMFTTRMHERYQIPVLVFLLIACVSHKSAALFAGYVALTGMTFLNHFIVLEEIFASDKLSGWIPRFGAIAKALSFANLFLYLILLAVILRILYRGGYRSFRRGVRALLPVRRSSPRLGNN